MQPVVPEGGLPDIVAPSGAQPLRGAIQVREDMANVGRIEWRMDDCIRPIELPFEFFAARRLADHDRAGRSAFVEPARDLVATRRELRLVDIAAIGDVVAAVFQYRRQHPAMLVRVVDLERALLQVGAARSDRVVIVEAPRSLSLLKQRPMRYQRSPADIADLDRARLID